MNKMPDRPSDIVSQVPWRHPEFKYHNELKHAKAAVSLKGFGTIYKWNWESDSWDVLYDIPRPKPSDPDYYYGRRRGPLPWAVDYQGDAPTLPGL
jgi:hypothetical protein